MNKTRIWISLLTTAALAGCGGTRDYAPAPGSDGEQMFEHACLECHDPDAGGKYFKLSRDEASPESIAERIREGGFMMPSFPNIRGEELRALSVYAASKVRLKD